MEDRVRELLDEKIEEIFATVQHEEGIKFGDISPWDAWKLEGTATQLVNIITSALELQKRMS